MRYKVDFVLPLMLEEILNSFSYNPKNTLDFFTFGLFHLLNVILGSIATLYLNLYLILVYDHETLDTAILGYDESW